MYRLGAHFRFTRPKHRDKDLRQAMRDDGGTVCLSLLSEVDRDIPQLKLAPAIGTVPSIVQDLYTRALYNMN